MKYEQKPIGELCDIVRENIIPNKDILYNLFSFSAFDNGRIPVMTYGKDIKSSKLKVCPNMILFNKLNVQFKRVWNIGNLTLLNSICSTEFIPIQAHEGVDKNYLYYCLISDYVTNAMYGARRGTSNSQQRISPTTLLNYKVSIPPFEEQHRISSILSALDDKIELNNKINKNLSA